MNIDNIVIYNLSKSISDLLQLISLQLLREALPLRALSPGVCQALRQLRALHTRALALRRPCTPLARAHVACDLELGRVRGRCGHCLAFMQAPGSAHIGRMHGLRCFERGPVTYNAAQTRKLTPIPPAERC